MEEKVGFLRKFLRYELKAAERYRRFVSLVMVTSPNQNGKAPRVLSDTLRNSDIMADFDGDAIILMSETNSAGALSAIERYKSKNADAADLRFSLVTYPSDGGGAEGLIAAGCRRLQKAVNSEEDGSVIMTG